jgi:hypothetical protein
MELPPGKISTKLRASVSGSLLSSLAVVIVAIAGTSTLRDTELGQFFRNPDNTNAVLFLLGSLIGIGGTAGGFFTGYRTEEKAFDQRPDPDEYPDRPIRD